MRFDWKCFGDILETIVTEEEYQFKEKQAKNEESLKNKKDKIGIETISKFSDINKVKRLINLIESDVGRSIKCDKLKENIDDYAEIIIEIIEKYMQKCPRTGLS